MAEPASNAVTHGRVPGRDFELWLALVTGSVSGNLHRPRRYHRGLQRVFYTSALISIRNCHASRHFYERKRAEGKRHSQAVLALARRRVNVLWALIRDGRCYQRELPVTAAP